MTTCVDFYKKWEKNPNWCKKSGRTVEEIEKYQNLLKELEEMGVLKERVICALPRSTAQPLMEISDPNKQKEAISEVAKALNRKTPTGGTYTKKLTKPQIEKFVEKVLPSETPKIEAPIVSTPIPDVKMTPATFKPAPITSQDPEKQRRAEKYYHAEELLERLPTDIKLLVTDIIQDNPSWKVADAFYYGILALSKMKKKF